MDVVWRQAMRAEVAVASDQHAAAITSDLKKFYEALDHELLLERAARHGFPMQIARLAVAAYRGPRMIRMGGLHSARALRRTGRYCWLQPRNDPDEGLHDLGL